MTRRTFAQLRDPDWLHQHYITENLGAKRIAALLGCDPKAVRVALKRAGIASPRGPQEAFSHPLLDDPDALAVAHRTRSMRQLAAEIGCHHSTVEKRLRDYGISS